MERRAQLVWPACDDTSSHTSDSSCLSTSFSEDPLAALHYNGGYPSPDGTESRLSGTFGPWNSPIIRAGTDTPTNPAEAAPSAYFPQETLRGVGVALNGRPLHTTGCIDQEAINDLTASIAHLQAAGECGAEGCHPKRTRRGGRGRRPRAATSTPKDPQGTKYKTRMCEHWVLSGGTHCQFGARCLFAHGPGDMRVTEDSAKATQQPAHASGWCSPHELATSGHVSRPSSGPVAHPSFVMQPLHHDVSSLPPSAHPMHVGVSAGGVYPGGYDRAVPATVSKPVHGYSSDASMYGSSSNVTHIPLAPLGPSAINHPQNTVNVHTIPPMPSQARPTRGSHPGSIASNPAMERVLSLASALSDAVASAAYKHLHTHDAVQYVPQNAPAVRPPMHPTRRGPVVDYPLEPLRAPEPDMRSMRSFGSFSSQSAASNGVSPYSSGGSTASPHGMPPASHHLPRHAGVGVLSPASSDSYTPTAHVHPMEPARTYPPRSVPTSSHSMTMAHSPSVMRQWEEYSPLASSRGFRLPDVMDVPRGPLMGGFHDYDC